MATELEREWKVLASSGKKPVSGTAIRTAYYDTVDGLYPLETAIEKDPATKDDKELVASVKALKAAFDNVSRKLDPYAWD